MLGRNHCGAGASKSIEHNSLSMGTVPDGIRHQCDRFDRRMKGKVGTLSAEAVHAGVAPDIGAVAAVLAEFDIIDVRVSS